MTASTNGRAASSQTGCADARRPKSIDLVGRGYRKRERSDGDAVIDQGLRLLEGRIAVYLLRLALAAVDGSCRARELVADPTRIAEHLGLHGGESRQRAPRAFRRNARRHRRLRHVRRSAHRALDETARALLVIIGARSEPRLERAASRLALKVEHDHVVTASGIGRRWLSAGIRE